MKHLERLVYIVLIVGLSVALAFGQLAPKGSEQQSDDEQAVKTVSDSYQIPEWVTIDLGSGYTVSTKLPADYITIEKTGKKSSLEIGRSIVSFSEYMKGYTNNSDYSVSQFDNGWTQVKDNTFDPATAEKTEGASPRTFVKEVDGKTFYITEYDYENGAYDSEWDKVVKAVKVGL